MKFLDFELKNYTAPVYVAEIGCNHRGQINEVFKCIEVAKMVGADVIKIQCYYPEDMTADNGYIIKEGQWKGRNLYDLYRRAMTPYEWVKPIFDFAKSCNVPIFSSVYDLNGLRILEELDCPAYKIASFEAHDALFVKKVCLTGKPVIISTGMMKYAEVKTTVNSIENKKIALLHCVSRYPTITSETNLSRITGLGYSFPGVPIGYSDHTNNIYSAVGAVALGACMIEKHFDGTYELGDPSEDSTFSVGPAVFGNMVKRCNQMFSAVSYCENPAAEEHEIKRSLHVVKAIKQGEIFTEEHIKSLRPNAGMAPNDLQYVLGRKSKIDILPESPLLAEYLE